MSELKKSASVVVGISTHNRAALLRKAIQSALDQSHRPLRIAIVDDGSSDETPLIQNEFVRTSWKRVPSAEGYVRARNHMMLNATEDYYVSLDDDAWFLAGDEISLAVHTLESCPKVAAIAFDILSPDRARPNGRGSSIAVPLFIGCGHVLRLSIVRALGGYQEFPRSYGGEETDLCLRLIDAGYDIIKLSGVHVWHDKTLVARDLAQQHASCVCNELSLTLRRAPLALLPCMVTYKGLSHLAFALKRRLIRSYVQGLAAFVANALDTWATRKPVRLSSLMRFYSLGRSPLHGDETDGPVKAGNEARFEPL